MVKQQITCSFLSLTNQNCTNYNHSFSSIQSKESFITMSLNSASAKLIDIGRTSFSSFTLKSPGCEAAATNPYRHAHAPVDHPLYMQQLQAKPGMRFWMILDTGIIRVFHSPVLIEDQSETPPVPIIVALLGDDIQGKTFITMSPLVFQQVALVLAASSTGTSLHATKTGPAVTDLFDDTPVQATLAKLHWQDNTYPGTPDMYFFPVIHAIPPSYMAHDNQGVTAPFPTDQDGQETWALQSIIRETMAYAHTHARGASIQNYNRHPFFAESNWIQGGPGADCFPNGNDIVADTIYSGFNIIDPLSTLAVAAFTEMELLVKTPLTREASTLANTNETPASGSNGINPTGSDSGNFLSALTGGISKILENTNEGAKRTQKKKNLAR